MFLACGVGAYTAGIFHLLTHAFFKALLFLSAGSVIHSLSGEQDMRKMGGLRKRIPITFWTMTMGVFAIAGIPPLAGFFSKDEILYQAFISNNPLGKLLWFVGLVTAGMTAFYMFRLWFKTFFGPERFDEHTDLHDHGAAVHTHSGSHAVMVVDPEESHTHGVHESPWIMLFPLVVLAILSIIGGWVGVPLAFGGHNEFEHFLDPVFNPATHIVEHTATRNAEPILAAASVLTALLGLYFAWLFYYKKPGTAAALAERIKPVYSLLDHKYWVDEIYGRFIVAPLFIVSRYVLGGLIDTGIVQGSAAAAAGTTRGAGSIVRRMQSGNIRSYAGWLAFGAAAVIAIVLFRH